MISREEKIKCPWCGNIDKLGVWNDYTYSKCTSRDMRRSFTVLTNERAFLRKSDTFYVCKKCNRWSRGSQLSIVDSSNPKLERLGRESIFCNIADSVIPNKDN